MWNDSDRLGFQIASWQYLSLLMRPRFLMTMVMAGALLYFCEAIEPSEIKAQKEVQLSIRRGEIHRNERNFKSSLETINKGIEIAPNLPETYAARGNLYSEWSIFLEEAKTNSSTRQRAEEFGFDLNAASKYRSQAIQDYQKALEVNKERPVEYSGTYSREEAFDKEAHRMIDCLKKKEVCYSRTIWSKL